MLRQIPATQRRGVGGRVHHHPIRQPRHGGQPALMSRGFARPAIFREVQPRWDLRSAARTSPRCAAARWASAAWRCGCRCDTSKYTGRRLVFRRRSRDPAAAVAASSRAGATTAGIRTATMPSPLQVLQEANWTPPRGEGREPARPPPPQHHYHASGRSAGPSAFPRRPVPPDGGARVRLPAQARSSSRATSSQSCARLPYLPTSLTYPACSPASLAHPPTRLAHPPTFAHPTADARPRPARGIASIGDSQPPARQPALVSPPQSGRYTAGDRACDALAGKEISGDQAGVRHDAPECLEQRDGRHRISPRTNSVCPDAWPGRS